MPFVDYFRPLCRGTAGTNSDTETFVVERYRRFGFPLDDREQVPPAPEIMPLPFDKLARGLTRLPTQPGLLFPNPTELGDGVGAGRFQPRGRGRAQCHATGRRMHGEMNILDGLAGHPD